MPVERVLCPVCGEETQVTLDPEQTITEIKEIDLWLGAWGFEKTKCVKCGEQFQYNTEEQTDD